jgi:hypothetical protein
LRITPLRIAAMRSTSATVRMCFMGAGYFGIISIGALQHNPLLC